MHVYHIHKYIHTIYTHAEVIPGFQKEDFPLNGKKGAFQMKQWASQNTHFYFLYIWYATE